MVVIEKDRKATKLSSSKLVLQMSMSEKGQLRIRVGSFKTCQQRVNKLIKFIFFRKEGKQKASNSFKYCIAGL